MLSLDDHTILWDHRLLTVDVTIASMFSRAVEGGGGYSLTLLRKRVSCGFTLLGVCPALWAHGSGWEEPFLTW